MKQFLQNYNLLFMMTAVTAIAILLKCICAIIYQILLRDSEQVQTTKNKWFRAMYTKYESCYRLQIPIHNPDCFINHYMAQYRFLGIPLQTLENTDIFCGLLVTSSTLLSVICGIYYELPTRFIWIHSMTLAFFLIFLGVGEFIFQVRHKRALLHLQLLNYFENTLQAKFENQYLHPEERQAYEQAYFDSDTEAEPSLQQETTTGKVPKPDKDADISLHSIFDEEKNQSGSISPDMQELIDSLLEESKITDEINKKQEKLQAAATNEKFRLVEEIMKEYL